MKKVNIGEDVQLLGDNDDYNSQKNTVAFSSETGIQRLFRCNKDEMLDIHQLSEILGICDRTVGRMVVRLELPKGIKFGGKNYWNVGSLVQWILDREEAAMKMSQKEAERILRLG